MTKRSRQWAGKPKIGFGLYIHWPFCLAKCPYCDFNSHVRKDNISDTRFTDALVCELQHFAGLTPNRRLASVFFGGGTPSLMPPAAVGRLLDAAARYWTMPDDAEITLEANPTSVEAANFRGYRAAGVNRLSVGVQALNDKDLQSLGRQHSVSEALAAYRLATQVFARTSFDLIYARPHQSIADWRHELQHALAEQQGHMSLYQLTIEPGTPYAALHARNRLAVPDDDLAADLYDLTQELTSAHGLPAYEVSNHAKPDHQSQHNLLYWRYGEYAGVGPGAHSRLIDETGTRLSVQTLKDPQAWQQQVEELGHGICEETEVSRQDAARERLLMGLRLTEGIAIDGEGCAGGEALDASKMQQLTDQGFLTEPEPGRIAATPAGRRVLNALIQELAV